MAGSSPRSTLDTLAGDLIGRQHGAYLAIDDDGILRDAGGELEHYRLRRFELGTNVLDELNYLHGVLPLEDVDYLRLPEVGVTRELSIPLTVFKRDGLNYVLFVDPSVDQHGTNIHAVEFRKHRSQDELLERHLGQELRRRVAAGLDSIEKRGERREVSVLFADLRGFTSFCDSNNTMDIFPLLNRFLGAMIKPVIEHGGMVDKIIGDAVMAVFGLEGDSDHKKSAIEAGAEMIGGVDKIASDSTAFSFGDTSVLGLGVGIASGQVAVGILGNDRRRSFSVIGHRVNLASRLESQARPGELLVDVATWEGLDDDTLGFTITDLWLKGLTRPVPAMSCFPSTKRKKAAKLAPVE